MLMAAGLTVKVFIVAASPEMKKFILFMTAKREANGLLVVVAVFSYCLGDLVGALDVARTVSTVVHGCF